MQYENEVSDSKAEWQACGLVGWCFLEEAYKVIYYVVFKYCVFSF